MEFEDEAETYIEGVSANERICSRCQLVANRFAMSNGNVCADHDDATRIVINRW